MILFKFFAENSLMQIIASYSFHAFIKTVYLHSF